MHTAAIYAGSFNPFHLGHLDIAQKAAKMFDKVFIVQAINSDKFDKQKELPVDFLEKEGFNCVTLSPKDLLTDFIDRIENNKTGLYGAYSGYDSITVIRGLRNVHDFTYEQNLEANYRRFKPDINIMYLFADIKYNDVSSSLLRSYGHLPSLKDLIVS